MNGRGWCQSNSASLSPPLPRQDYIRSNQSLSFHPMNGYPFEEVHLSRVRDNCKFDCQVVSSCERGACLELVR